MNETRLFEYSQMISAAQLYLNVSIFKLKMQKSCQYENYLYIWRERNNFVLQ